MCISSKSAEGEDKGRMVTETIATILSKATDNMRTHLQFEYQAAGTKDPGSIDSGACLKLRVEMDRKRLTKFITIFMQFVLKRTKGARE